MIKLNLKDLKILSLLDKNARMPINSIAKKIHLNKDVVRYRIKKLENEKVILSYYTVIDTHKLGYFTIRIYFDCIGLSEETEQKLINYLDKVFKAGQIFKIDGEYQVGILTWEKSIYELERKLRDLKKNFGDYLNNYEVSIFTKYNQYFRKYLPESKNSLISLEESKIEKIDQIDIKILKELSKNARVTSVDLGEKLKLAQRTIIYRIKNLEKKKIILGYRINIDITFLKRENFFLELFISSKENLKEIEGFAQQHKDCVGIDYVLHGADIELELETEGKKGLLQFLSELKNRFKHIKKIKYWSTLEYSKIEYLP